MRWPIRNQILVPFAAILLIAVALISLSAAYLSARRSEQATVDQLNQVIETLGRSSFPYSENVLLQMRGLSGAEFAAFDGAGNLLAATLPREDLLNRLPRSQVGSNTFESFANDSAVEIDGTRYLLATVAPTTTARTRKLFVLYPETSLQQTRREAALPPLIVGAATLLLMVLAAAWLANRLSGRIRRVQLQVANIAAGDFSTVEASGPIDEIRELIASVNTMSAQLQGMQQTIAQTARAQLLGQLAGGLAHQLRNAVTGARMAIEIHGRRCDAADDDSLDVALRQLRLTEEQVKGLLSVGQPERREPVPIAAIAIVNEISALVGPACQHAGVDWQTNAAANVEIPDSESVRTAVLNLALNAIEAAGPGGHVQLNVEMKAGEPIQQPGFSPSNRSVTFNIIDDGPGPPDDLSDKMFDLFVTSKPEGVGFGLALARQAADSLGGQLTWNRDSDRTTFRFEIPVKSGVVSKPEVAVFPGAASK